ncbi:EAL domain-containing protein [Actinoplanes sp. NPDC026623]|uniref:putative bifunctional diguanylate cyclase/phosphodiesterase n=1 Tax=Actinoplanes sp. NPDC026623 TaxID=3155610 RepID=UPI0033D58CFD
MTTRLARACFTAWMAVLTAINFAWPQGHALIWSLIGLSGAAAVVVGVRANRPARNLPWYLLAAALMIFVTADVFAYLRDTMGASTPLPGLSDLLYLVVYPLLAAALTIFIRARSGGANRVALLDALVPTVGLGLLSWIYLIAPYTQVNDLSLHEKAVAIGYPLGDTLALALMLRLLIVPGRKPLAVRLLCVSVVGVLVSDVLYGMARLDGVWSFGGPSELGWIVFYGAAGYAALHPSMTQLTDDAPHGEGTVGAGGRRLLLMTLAAMVAPAVLLAQHLGGGVTNAPVIAAGSALMFLLVMGRVHGLLADQRQTNLRESALRRANARLSAATTEDDIVTAIRTAIGELMPAGRRYRLIVDEPVPVDHPAATGRDVSLVPAPVPGFGHALRAEMILPGSPPMLGSMHLAAPAPALRTVLPAVQMLFDQVSMVVERIGMAGEISRRDGETYFRTLIQSASDVILIIDDDDLIRYASPSATTVFGWTGLPGRPLAGLIADTHLPALTDALARARAGHGESEAVDLTAVCADRRLRQVECAGRDLRDDPTVAGLVLTVRDVTERRSLENDLAHQAFHDGLTGLANRVLFRDRLEQSFVRSEQGCGKVGVLFVDLDDFKEVNDTLGHAVGDQLLVAIGQRITRAIGASNTAARMGGDEFAILIEDATDPAEAEQVAERIVVALSEPVEVSDGLGGTHLLSGAASVGVATSHDATSPTELLRHADLALYLAKGVGKATWRRYRNELHAEMVARLALRTSLLEAIDAEQFVLQYQPIVDVRTQAVVGVESLVRWQHPERGLLSPAHFIELAEESGAVVPLGAWVLCEALRQFASWRAEDPDIALRYVSVNVSARQFRQPGFVDQVRQAIDDAGARPEWLLLEITESLVLRDAEQVWADLRALRALGVRIAIDDFGTGYSSLSYLRQMPVDVLKIDKSFIDDILASKQQRALVDAIVTLAHNLDLTVVAEGIEKAAQHEMLELMGCPYGQGYLFSEPLWPAQIPALLGRPVAVAA